MNRLTVAITMALVTLGLFASTSPVLGVTRTWDGGGGADNNFNTPANWSADTMPGTGDLAEIDNGATALINQNSTMDQFYLGGVNASSGYAEMTGGTVNLTKATVIGFCVGYSTTSQGGLTLSDGTINVAGGFSLAQSGHATDITKASIGVIRQTGGSLLQSDTYASWNANARFGGSYAYYDLSGGNLRLANGYFGGNSIGNGVGLGVGYINQTGGTFTIKGGDAKGLRLSSSGGSIGIYNLTGGTGRVMTGGVVLACNGGYNPLGVINVGGTGQFTIDYQGVVAGTSADIGYLRVGGVTAGVAGDGVVNLATGGVLTAPLIYSGDGATTTTAGNASLNFHGGTLVTNADQVNYLRLMDAYVYSEGAKINTDGHNVTINRALLAPSGYGLQALGLATGGGGAGYDGPPAVRITGGHGTGATALATVVDGAVTGLTVTNPGSGYQEGDTLTVQLWGGGASTAANVDTITLGAYATSGGLQKQGLGTLTLAGANKYTGPTSVQAGRLAVTGSITSNVTVDAVAALSGTGTITGDVDLIGTFAVNYSSDTDTIDRLTISGNLDLTGGTISLTDLGSGELDPANEAYVFATYGTLTGSPTVELGVPTGWTVDYAYGEANNEIALVAVPEPAMLALVAGLMMALSAARIRR